MVCACNRCTRGIRPSHQHLGHESPLATARGGTDVEAINGLFYVMGGCCGSVSSDSILMSKTIEVYNPTTNTWTTRTQHCYRRGRHGGVYYGKIYVAKSAATESTIPRPIHGPSFAHAHRSAKCSRRVINGKLYVAEAIMELWVQPPSRRSTRYECRGGLFSSLSRE